MEPLAPTRDGISGIEMAEPDARKPQNSANKLAKNSAANVVRLGVTSLVSIVLPAYLTHKLSVETYGAWVLILQLGAYVAYLDFGVQTAVSKYIAEYEAKNDYAGCGRCVSIALLIMLVAGALGALLTAGFAWQAPILFKEIPSALLGEVRISVLLVGFSLSVGLPAAVFSAIFLGLQRYQVPMMTGVISKLLYGFVICAAVYRHSSLISMATAVAAVNLLTSLLQIVCWKKLAGQIRVSLRAINKEMALQMGQYCAVLTIWSVCMLFINGLDITIVGHYAFNELAFYSVASAPNSFVLLVIGAVLGPLLPATSALSVNRSPKQMGSILLRATRYSTILLFVTGLPVMIAGYPLLHLWVGKTYAFRSVSYLRILVGANIIRNLCAPYATMVVATSQQKLATASAISEAVVNLSCSIILARHLGAYGVALGTLIGAIVGVAMHFGLSMHYTRRNLDTARRRLFWDGMGRPALMAIPACLLITHWWIAGPPTIHILVWFVLAAATVLLAWFVSMNAKDRAVLANAVFKK